MFAACALPHNRHMNMPSLVFAAWCAAWVAHVQALAQVSSAPSLGAAPVVMRCPGPPVLYADNLTPQEARSRSCKPLNDLPVAQAPSTAARAPAGPVAAVDASGSSAVPAGSSAQADGRVRVDEQRQRDAEARRILEAELRREEGRLREALNASGTGRPGERSSAETAQIRRVESDIEAIRRELARLR